MPVLAPALLHQLLGPVGKYIAMGLGLVFVILSADPPLFYRESEEEANMAEVPNIQAAMGAMMALHRILEVNENKTAVAFFW